MNIIELACNDSFNNCELSFILVGLFVLFSIWCLYLMKKIFDLEGKLKEAEGK